MTHNLSQRALLTALNISMWTGRRYDKQASAEVADSHGTNRDVGRYHKRLLAESESSMTVKKVANEARDFHYTYTLPWTNEGARILTACGYMTYMPKMRQYKQLFDTAVTQFALDYPQLKRDAPQRLNGLYNAADYPEEITDRFRFEVVLNPLPDSNDFRVHLTDTEVAGIKEQIAEQTKAAQAAAMADVWQRVYTAVSHMATRLASPEAVFRNTLVKNVRELVTLLPSLNLTADANLIAVCQEIDTTLGAHDAEELRESQTKRADVARAAAAIQAKMAQFMPSVAQEEGRS